MFSFFINLDVVWQSLLAGIFTFLITTLGSALVIFFKSIKKVFMDGMLAISAGIMLAASFFSLLIPAIEISDSFKLLSWAIVPLSFMFGGFILSFGNYCFNSLSLGNDNVYSFRRCAMLFISITLHNIPEGLVLGVAFASIPYGINNANIISAITLTIAIAIQNFPEGSAISLPFRRDGFSRLSSFLFGSLSAIVEPIFAVIGAILVTKVQTLLPFIMSFTAGAMTFVCILELIPESLTNKKKDLMALLVLIGFSIMMLLELILG